MLTLVRSKLLWIAAAVFVLVAAGVVDLPDGDNNRERCGNRQVVNMSLEIEANFPPNSRTRSIDVAVAASLGTIEGNYANPSTKVWNIDTDPKKRWAHKFVACMGDGVNAEVANVANAPVRIVSCYFYRQVGAVDKSEEYEVGDGAFPDYMDITRDYTHDRADLGRCATTVL